MPLRIVQITDPHLLAPGEELMGIDVSGRLERVLDEAGRFNPDTYFFTGDFCAHEPVMDVYHRLRERFDLLDVPYYLVPGNHDDRQMLRNAFYLAGHGQESIHGLVRVKDHDFLFLDSSKGVIDTEQLEWIRRAVSLYPRAAIVMHHPPVPLGVTFMDNKYPLRDNEQLVDILTSDGRRRRVFCGHYHASATVSHHNLDIFLCPPTSFHIDPRAEEFEQDHFAPGFMVLDWTDDGDFRATRRIA